MKAVQISECGGTEVLQLVDVPLPAKGPSRVSFSFCCTVAAIAASRGRQQTRGLKYGSRLPAAQPAALAVQRRRAPAPHDSAHSQLPLAASPHWQVLIKSVSIGANPVDLLVREGSYKPEQFPKVPLLLCCLLVGRGQAAGQRHRALGGACPPCRLRAALLHAALRLQAASTRLR